MDIKLSWKRNPKEKVTATGLIVSTVWAIGYWFILATVMHLFTGCGVSAYVKRTEVTTVIVEAALEGLTRFADKQLGTEIVQANSSGDNRAKLYSLNFWNTVYDDINTMYSLTQNFVAQVKLDNEESACHFLSDLRAQVDVTVGNIDTHAGNTIASSLTKYLTSQLDRETLACRIESSASQRQSTVLRTYRGYNQKPLIVTTESKVIYIKTEECK